MTCKYQLAEMAEKSLDVQYYLYHTDPVGRLFTGLLLKAADLLAVVTGYGLLKIDRNSELIWAVPIPAHHDLFVTEP